MASKVYPLPKLYHPDFALPNVKPKGPVEIDWDNPITRDLRACFIPDAHGTMREVISGDGPISDTGSVRATQHGLIRAYDPTTPDQSEYTVQDAYNILSPSGHSIFVIVDYDALTNYGGLCSCSTTVTSHGWTLDTGSAPTRKDIAFLRSNGSGYNQWAGDISGNDISAGDTFKRICVTSSDNLIGTQPKIYIDGVETTSYDNILNTDTGAITVSTSNMFIGARKDDASKLDGGIHMVCIFDRELSEAEVKELTGTPFQILRPAIPLTYFVPAAAPAGGNEPLFYHHQRMLSRCS